MSFGSRVRISRERVRMANGKRMTQGQLAKMVGVKRNTVSRWENSGVLPRDPETMRLLAEALRVPVDYLIRTDGEGDLTSNRETPASERAPVVRDGPPRQAYRTQDVLMQLVPPKAYEVIHEYATRLEHARVAQLQMDEAMAILLRAAATPLRPLSPHDRTVGDMIADIESAWTYIATVLRRDGKSV